MDWLVAVLRMIEAGLDNAVAAAWAQAIATTLAIIVTIFLTMRTRSTRRREMKQAARSICDRGLSVLHGLALKQDSGQFSQANIDSSQDEVEAAVRMLESLPVAELGPREIEPYLVVHKQMLTARRRLRFIRERLDRGDPALNIGRFADLKQVAEDAASLLGRSSSRRYRHRKRKNQS